MVLDCVKEKDSSIKREALHVLNLIAHDKIIKQIVKELLNYIVEAEDDFIQELTQTTITIIENNSPNRSWQINHTLRVLTLAGKHLKDESISTFLQLIAATPQLQSSSLTQIFYSLKENILQNALARVCLWCIGEFGELIERGETGVTSDDVFDLADRLLNNNKCNDDSIKSYILNCMIKLYARLRGCDQQIFKIINSLASDNSVEIQQRAFEYLSIMTIKKLTSDQKRSILNSMPVSRISQ